MARIPTITDKAALPAAHVESTDASTAAARSG